MKLTKENLKLNIEKKYRKTGFFRRVFSWGDILDSLIKDIENLELDHENQIGLDILSKKNDELNSKINDLNNNLNSERNLLKEQIENNGFLKSDLKSSNDKIINYTKELYDVFKSSEGSKGKLAEIKLENILKLYFGLEGENWIKNLSVGNDIVEFGIKTDLQSSKWIPVDSKCLIPNEMENDEFIIDSKYIAKIKAEAKKIQKYINKENTESYALMVLPGDNIFNTLFNKDKSVFHEVSEIGVYITSPSNFIQFIRTIDKLNSKMELVNQSREIVDEINIIVNHMKNFHSSTKDGLNKMQTAFTTHMKNTEKKLETINDSLKENKRIN